MSGAASWWGLLLSTDAPALPAAWAMQVGLALGWALVLAALATALSGRMALPLRRALALGLMLWTLLPGPLSPHYWLGLAFQLPSLSAMLLCAWYLQRRLLAATQRPGTLLDADAESGASAVRRLPSYAWMVLLPAVLLGYALLLDTFAVLPLQLYAWGFGPAALLLLLALSQLPWVLRTGSARGLTQWIAPAALLLFAFTRLPSGNVWDALLDPWLWLLLQVLLVRDLYQRRRHRVAGF